MSDISCTTLAPLPAPNPQQIYTDLTSFLHPPSPTALPPKLEILPPALTPTAPPSNTNAPPSTWPLLISPPHLGIPKTSLIQAVVIARDIFSNSSPPITTSSPEALQRRVLEAATVLLLFDPEHATAANYHRSYFSVNHEAGSLRVPEWSIEAEFTLVEGLLTSPGLDKHSKSPTLWSLRRWLMRRFGLERLKRRRSMEVFEVPLGTGVGGDGKREEEDLFKRLQLEFGVVRLAGGVHARNYHAWQYARFILTHHLPPELTPSTHSSTSTTDSPPSSSTSLLNFTKEHFNHSLLHPTDTSIWSFLLFLLITYPTSTSPVAVYILSHTISVLTELEPSQRGAVPRGEGLDGREAMWNFVKIALGGGENGEGLVQLSVARRTLLRRIEMVAGQGGEQARSKVREEEAEEIQRIVEQRRSDSPLIISLVQEGPERPGYLSERRFAWRAWAWITRRDLGEQRLAGNG